MTLETLNFSMDFGKELLLVCKSGSFLKNVVFEPVVQGP